MQSSPMKYRKLTRDGRKRSARPALQVERSHHEHNEKARDNARRQARKHKQSFLYSAE